MKTPNLDNQIERMENDKKKGINSTFLNEKLNEYKSIKEQLTLTDVGSSNSVKETVKNFADIDMFLNDINNDSFDKNDKGLGKVSRIANKYIIKLR